MSLATGLDIISSLVTRQPRGQDNEGYGSEFQLSQGIPGASGTGSTSSGSLISLPQNGGQAQTVDQILDQVENTGGSRSEALFGDVQVRDSSGNLTDPINLRQYAQGSFVPEGRDDWLRNNDQQAIAGLQALVDSGKIGPNTVVIVDHGHGPEIVQVLTGNAQLRAEAEFVNAYKTGTGANDGKFDALPTLDQMQSYLDTARQNQERNGKGGAVVLAVDAHGAAPDRSTMPSAEELKAVMGPEVNIVYVNEASTGTNPDPTVSGGRFSDWLQQMEAAGIQVDGYGINSRPSGGNPGGGLIGPLL